MPIISLRPVDEVGLTLNRPDSESKWVKLTNVSFRDGSLVPRPGFREFADINDLDRPNTVEPTPILALSQIENPGSSATGRESWTVTTETLRPDGSSDLVAGWTGDHTAIDETPPSGDSMSTATEGAQKSLTFPNPSTTFSSIFGVMISGLARTNQSGGYVDLKFYQRISTTNYAIDTVRIYTEQDLESDQWQPFAIWMPLNLDNDDCLVQADLDALNIVVEYVSGVQTTIEWTPPAGDGSNTDFVAPGGSTSTYTDFDNDSWTANESSTEDDGAVAAFPAADKKQGFSIGAFNTTFSTIDNINFILWTWQAGAAADIQFKLIYKNSGGTEFDLTADGKSSSTITNTVRKGHHLTQNFLSFSTNPETETNWTEAEITGGEFIVQSISNEQWILRSVTPIVEGATASQTAYLNTLKAEVAGTTSSLPGSGLATTRLWATSLDEVRVDDDVGATPTLTDVTNSVSLTSSPPIVPIDQGYLYGQVYLVNGVDNTIRYPDGSNLFEGLSTNNADGATALTGRTIAGFADRIIYGWVKDNTTVTPERIAYSKIFDGGTHVDASRSAGDFDLLDTPGGVVNLTPLNEDLCFAGKEQGIYALRRSGNSLAPIFRDVIDFQTRCLSITGVQRVTNSEGRPIVLFLGWAPAAGYNIFAFDGTKVVPVGDPIAPALRDDANHNLLRFAFTGVEPRTGAFWIAFAEGTSMNVNSGYAFHTRTGAWTRFELPFDIFSFGTWSIPTNKDSLTASCRPIWGEPRLIAGTLLPMEANTDWANDSLSPPTHAAVGSDPLRFENASAGSYGRVISQFTSTLETGDLDIGEDQNVIGYRWRIEYEDLGPFRVRIDASVDGGKNWTPETPNEYYLGGRLEDRNETVTDFLDIDPVHSQRARFRIRIGAETDKSGNQPWKINALKLDHVLGGDAA